MKSIATLLCPTVCGLCLTSCTPKEHSVTGTIARTTTTSLSVALRSGDTVTFDALHADRSQANRLTLGNSVEVFYTGNLGEAPRATRIVHTGHSRSHVALAITSPIRADRLIGAWFCAKSGSEDRGFILAENGRVGSIGSTPQPYRTWKLEKDRLILQGTNTDRESIVRDTFRIRQLTTTDLQLERDGKTETYLRTQHDRSGIQMTISSKP